MISKCVFRKTYGFNKNRIHEFLTLCECKFVNHFAVRAEFKAMVKWPDYTQGPMQKTANCTAIFCRIMWEGYLGRVGGACLLRLIAATRYCRYVAIPELLQPPAPQAR
jgi:hypothetical protein